MSTVMASPDFLPNRFAGKGVLYICIYTLSILHLLSFRM